MLLSLTKHEIQTLASPSRSLNVWILIFDLSLVDFVCSERSKALQMCVAEPGRVLQAIPKETINADVSGPNQSIRHQPGLLERHRGPDEKQGCHERVDDIIERRPEPCA